MKADFRWTCRDRRYLIKATRSSSNAYRNFDSKCQWNNALGHYPDDLTCVLTYCDKATEDPNSVGYNFTEQNKLVSLENFTTYPCKNNYKVEADLDWKEDAENETLVKCKTDGFYEYPTEWPQCSETVSCPDPGNSEGVLRTHTTDVQDLTYGTVFNHKCEDPRRWIKHDHEPDTALVEEQDNPCHWRKTFPHDGTTFVCIIHHCSHPHDNPGNHPPPPVENKISLATQTLFEVPFNEYITYRCEPNTFFEDDSTTDPEDTELAVQCTDVTGEYNTPVKQGKLWPNCTETVFCGQPPKPPVNGTITWLSPATEFDEAYNTNVMYHCPNGTQFDTDNDGKGDSVNITIRCQWNKAWNPYPTLPPCIVTHCVEPFKIPEETYLEELTSEWTEINQEKAYQCKGKVGDTHTRFWESDRTKSTFELLCNEDGYFTWQEWPICLEGNKLEYEFH